MRGNLSDRYNRVYAGDISNSPKGIGMVDRGLGKIKTGKNSSVKKMKTNRIKNRISETLGKVVVYGILVFFLLLGVGYINNNEEVITNLGENTFVLGDVVYDMIDKQAGKLEDKLHSTFNQALY